VTSVDASVETYDTKTRRHIVNFYLFIYFLLLRQIAFNEYASHEAQMYSCRYIEEIAEQVKVNRSLTLQTVTSAQVNSRRGRI